MQVAWSQLLDSVDYLPAGLSISVQGALTVLGVPTTSPGSPDSSSGADPLPVPGPPRLTTFAPDGSILTEEPIADVLEAPEEVVSLVGLLLGPAGERLTVHRVVRQSPSSESLGSRALVMGAFEGTPTWSTAANGTAYIEPLPPLAVSPTSTLVSLFVSAEGTVELNANEVAGEGCLVLAWLGWNGEVLAAVRTCPAASSIRDLAVSATDTLVLSQERRAPRWVEQGIVTRYDDLGAISAESALEAEEGAIPHVLFAASWGTLVALSATGRLLFGPLYESTPVGSRAVLVGLEADLSTRWTRPLDATGPCQITAVAQGPGADVLVGGSFEGVLTTDAGVLTTVTRSGFVLRIDPLGHVVEHIALPSFSDGDAFVPTTLRLHADWLACVGYSFVATSTTAHARVAVARVDL